MIRNTLKSILQTIRALMKNRGRLAIIAGLYMLLLTTLYGFITTREATIWQVLLTLLFAGISPLFFFLLHATVIHGAQHNSPDWYQTLRESCRLALLALPVILAGVAIALLLDRWQAHFPPPYPKQLAWSAVSTASSAQISAATAEPLHWPTVFFATLRSLIFAIVLPLATIRLWIELGNQRLFAFVRGGWRSSLTSLTMILARAFEPQSLLIYSSGLIVFFLIPYLLLFIRLPLPGTWSEISVFTARVTLALLFSLMGWVITLATFANTSGRPTDCDCRECAG